MNLLPPDGAIDGFDIGAVVVQFGHFCLELMDNDPPALDPIGDLTVALGSSLTLTLSATDPEKDSISFGAQPLPLPQNMSLHGQTGEFVFRPDATQVGTFDMTFSAMTGPHMDSEEVTITVEGPDPGGITELSGRLLDTTDFTADPSVETPVVGATISLLDTGVSTTSDSSGDFTLSNAPEGSQVLDIDTTTANPGPGGSSYAGFREEIELIADVTNVVDRPFFLPRIDTASLTTVVPAQTTMVENTALEVMMEVPPITAKNADGSDFTGELSISEVPDGLAPAALPGDLEPGLLITIQPVGVVFDPPVPITFPNIDNLPPGSETDLWSLDPEAGTFVVVGTGQVSGDGTEIQTIDGGIRAADWHMTLAPSAVGATDTTERSDENEGGEQSAQCQLCGDRGETQVSVLTGELDPAATLPSYRSQGVIRSVAFIYSSLGADQRPVIPFDSTILRRAAVPPTISYSLEVGGVQQGEEIFVDTSGLSESQDETIRNAVQFDASNLPTGRYPYTLRITSNYSSSRVSTTVTGEVLVRNEADSPFGAGWTLAGLQRLHLQPDGDAILTHDGAALRFRQRSCAEPSAGLVAWWPGDGSADDMAGASHGTLQNGASFGPGMVGQAFSLDGVDDYVELGDILNETTVPFALETWIKTPGGTDNGIFWSDDTPSADAGNYHGFLLLMQDDFGVSYGSGGTATIQSRRSKTTSSAIDASVTFEQEGLYWFDFELEGKLLTRMSMEVLYNRLVTGSPPPSQGPQ